jgi:hypothetical protein
VRGVEGIGGVSERSSGFNFGESRGRSGELSRKRGSASVVGFGVLCGAIGASLSDGLSTVTASVGGTAVVVDVDVEGTLVSFAEGALSYHPKVTRSGLSGRQVPYCRAALRSLHSELTMQSGAVTYAC